ncbi:hypothetical protein [Rhizobium sp. BR 315]|uniref:Uncharacterized protein n=1 Tax=Rhizobium miluonense TaxID=411945 RepID=A0A1C3W7V1_9HYPH|nr:hypothetical protein GA0061102_102494 [Rhizobium miluonense]
MVYIRFRQGGYNTTTLVPFTIPDGPAIQNERFPMVIAMLGHCNLHATKDKRPGLTPDLPPSSVFARQFIRGRARR